MAYFIGTAGNDNLNGGDESDYMDGNAGNDQLSGGNGSDSIAGNQGEDILYGGEGNDDLYSGDRSPHFFLPYYDNPMVLPLVDRGAERDSLNGGSGNDRLFAGYGDNVDGGVGEDSLFISFLAATSGVNADFSQTMLSIGGGFITGIENISFVEGSNFDDFINVASPGSNGYSDRTTVFGMGGNDILLAGYYTAYLDGGDGNDIVDGRGSQYIQAVIGGAGDDVLYTNSNTFARADGGDGNDRIFAHGKIDGGAGDDYIEIQYSYYGGEVSGGSGNDEIRAATNPALIAGGSGADLIIGHIGNDRLGSADFGPYPSILADDMGLEQDTIYGVDGDDLIAGGYGDNLDGGAGQDTLRYSMGGMSQGIDFDTAIFAPGQFVTIGGGTVVNFEALAYFRATEFDDIIRVATQTTFLEVNAGAGNDLIYTGGSFAQLFGGAGNDRFVSSGIGGMVGNLLHGGDGIDEIDYSAYASGVTVTLSQQEFVSGSGPGGDRLNGIENITGTAFADTLTGNNDANEIRGGAGNDTINGGAGNDKLYGEGGDDVINGGFGADAIWGGAGNDIINGGGGGYALVNETIFAEDGDDLVIVEGAQNSAYVVASGGTGFDTLRVQVSGDTGTNFTRFTGFGFTGFERLDLRSGTNFEYVSNFAEIVVAPQITVNLLDSLNPNVNLAVNGNMLSLFRSSLATVTGSDAAERVELGRDSVVRGAIALGGGNDDFVLSETALGTVPASFGSVDGGAGVDTFKLAGIRGERTFDFATTTGFERLWINAEAYLPPATITITNASGLSQIMLAPEVTLVVKNSVLTHALVTPGAGVVIEAGSAIGGYGYPTDGPYDQRTDVDSSQPGNTSYVINNGTITGDVKLGLGNNLYDGRGGTIGGTVYGSGGNDTLLGGAGSDKLQGGFGNDVLSGGLGIDVLSGGAGADIFRGTAAEFAGDVITDFTAGDRIIITDVTLSDLNLTRNGDVISFTGGSFTFSGPSAGYVTVREVAGNVELGFSSGQFFGQSPVLVANFGIGAGGWSSQTQYPRHVGDVNGDGYRDIVGFGAAGVLVSFGSASGSFSTPGLAIADFGQATGWRSDDQFHRELIDVNGDGRADIVGFGTAGTLVALARANGTFANQITGIANFGTDQGWSTQEGFARTVGDINGDDKADIIGFGTAGTLVALGNGDGTFQAVKFAIANFGVAQGWGSDNSFHREVADVNGDGFDDIIGFGVAGTLVALSNGDGSFRAAQFALGNFGKDQGWSSQRWFARDVGDVNGDGRADVIGFGVLGTYVAYGRSDGSFEAPRLDVQAFGTNQSWGNDDIMHRELADINNDGALDIVGFGVSGVVAGLNQGHWLA